MGTHTPSGAFRRDTYAVVLDGYGLESPSVVLFGGDVHLGGKRVEGVPYQLCKPHERAFHEALKVVLLDRDRQFGHEGSSHEAPTMSPLAGPVAGESYPARSTTTGA